MLNAVPILSDICAREGVWCEVKKYIIYVFAIDIT